jgi:hypothetical protein
MTTPLTATSLAALQQQQLQQQQALAAAATLRADVGGLDGEEASLRALVEQEASVARREHVLALLREYHQLQALSPAEAAGWQQRREAGAARRVQSAWRRRGSRRSFLEVVRRSQLHRRAKAATTIQRAQRTRQHVVAEAAPPISREQVQAIQKDVIAQTLAMARELRDARAAQEAWRAAGGGAAEAPAAADAAADAAGGSRSCTPSGSRRGSARGSQADGSSAPAVRPTLPAWLEAPTWEREMATQKPGGSAVVHELRAAARRGQHTDAPQAEMVHAVRNWPQLRASMQAAAVRRQVARTQAAALHAQLRYPPPLPPAPPPSAGAAAAAELALPPVLPSKASVLHAHRRLLREERLKLVRRRRSD